MSIKDRGSKRGSIRKKKTSEILILRGLSYHLFSLSGAYGTAPYFLSIDYKPITYHSKNAVKISKSNDLETISNISFLSSVTPMCHSCFAGSKLCTFSETTKYLIINLIYFFLQCKVRAYI